MPSPLSGAHRLIYFCHLITPFFSSSRAFNIPSRGAIQKGTAEVTVHGSRMSPFAADVKWRVHIAGITALLIFLVLPPLTGEQNQALSPAPSTEKTTSDIDTYIR